MCSSDLELDLYRTVHIRPWADFRRMDVLTVLAGKPHLSPSGTGGGGP